MSRTCGVLNVLGKSESTAGVSQLPNPQSLCVSLLLSGNGPNHTDPRKAKALNVAKIKYSKKW